VTELGPEILTLKIPTAKEFVDVVRLMVAGLGARMDFTYDDVEDLKIAVEEACSRAAEQPENNIHIEFLIFEDRLEVCLRGVPSSIWTKGQDQLILKAVTDEVKLTSSGDKCDLYLLKYRAKKTA